MSILSRIWQRIKKFIDKENQRYQAVDTFYGKEIREQEKKCTYLPRRHFHWGG